MDPAGKLFERLTKWFLENDPEYRAQFARVWLWDDWPGRWGVDRGIDLVGETHAGANVAIQAKNYGEAHSISKRDVDTFLSESNRVEIAERLLVGSTDRLAGSARTTMAAQEKPVATCLLSRLMSSPVSWPASMDDLRPGRPTRHVPRPDQDEALDAIARWARTDGRRAQVIRACGTGKTMIGAWAAEQLEAKRVLVLVPTLALMRQTVLDWAQNAESPLDVLRICSDTSRMDDDFIRGDELGSNGTTDVSRIAERLGSSEQLLVLCTYDSSPTLAEAIRGIPGFEFDLAIADEAHRCAGLERSSNKTILKPGALPAHRTLFLTATPTIYGVRQRGQLRQHAVAVASMDDPAKFGPVIHRLSFAEAIRRELLCPYQVAVIPIDDEEIHNMIQRRRLVTADGDQVLEAESLATQIACARAMRRFACKRIVAFHPTVRDSKRFAAHFPTAAALMSDDDRPQSRIWSEHVDGAGMSYSDRSSRLRRFREAEPDEHRILSNVRMLTEGVDVPGIDAIAFLHTHRGQAAIIQAVGRAVRPAEGKTIGTIVLPIILRADESMQAALARSEHRHVVDILGALRSHDPDIHRSLDDLRFHKNHPAGEPSPNGRFVIDAPIEVGEEFADAVDLALTTALGVSTKRSMRRGRAPVLLLEPQAPPSADEAFLIGLHEIQSLGVRRLLPRLPATSHGFPMTSWWEEARRRWTRGHLDLDDRQAIADSMSWLTPDLSPGEERIRDDMAETSEADVCEQLASQLAPGGRYARTGLRILLDDDGQQDGLVDDMRVIHDLLTHAAMSPRMQLLFLQMAMTRAAKAVRQAAKEPASSQWYSTPPRQAAILGFAAALADARTGGYKARGRASVGMHAEDSPGFDCGQRAAAPLAKLVRRMEIFRFAKDREEVAYLKVQERALPADDRLDALGWDIYLLVRARSDWPMPAQRQAMDGTLEQRRRVRADLLRRPAIAPTEVLRRPTRVDARG